VYKTRNNQIKSRWLLSEFFIAEYDLSLKIDIIFPNSPIIIKTTKRVMIIASPDWKFYFKFVSE
jgi:hypothetical protein